MQRGDAEEKTQRVSMTGTKKYALNFQTEICYNERIPFRKNGRWQRCFVEQAAAKILRLHCVRPLSYWNEKGQIETLQEHHHDASFKAPLSPIL